MTWKEKIAELKARIDSFDDALFGERTPMPQGLFPIPQVTPYRNVHPRLNLRGDMLEGIRKVLLEDQRTPLAQEFKKLYECDFDGFAGVCPDGVSNYDGRHHAIIEAKALAYLLTGDELYAYEAIFAAKNYMLSIVIRHDLASDIFRGWGRIMTVVGEVYDWCYPVMTERDRRQFIAGVEWKLCRNCTCGKGDKMTIGFPPLLQNAVAGHGTNVALQRDYLGFAIAVYDEYPDWWELIGGRFFAEYVPANNVFYPAGMNPQGTNNYVWGKYYAQLHSAWLVKTATGVMPYDKGIEDVVYGLMGMKMPNGRYFSLGDGGITREGAKGRVTHLAVAAALFPSPLLKRHARIYTDDYTFYDWDVKGSMMTPSLYGIFLANGYAGEEAKSDFDGLDLVHYYCSPMGQMSVRNSWSQDGAAVLMRISELSGGNHDHEDAGTFQIYYKGCFTAESGAYGSGAGYGTSHHRYWHQATISHNGLLIYNNTLSDTLDGWYSGGQNRHGGVSTVADWLGTDKQKTGRVISHSFAKDGSGEIEYAYLAGDITQAYSKETVEKVERRMLAIYGGSVPLVFAVYDDVVSKEPEFTKSFIMHTLSEPDISENRATYTYGEGKMVLTTLSSGAVMKKYGGRGKSFWINDSKGALNKAEDGKGTAARKGDLDHIADGAAWGRIQIDHTGNRQDLLLNVISVTDKDVDFNAAPKKIESSDGIGFIMDGAVAFFVNGSEGAHDQVRFSTEKSGKLRYFVCGVTEGEWTVRIGESTETVQLDSTSGVIYFCAESGDVVLTRRG